LLLVLADNQLPGAQALEKAGAALVLGNVQNVSQVFEKHMHSDANLQLKRLALAAAAVSDGLGVHRIVAAILSE
jgi:spore coat polysaccharide biosynthesis predicted glycosyltransferase SpsG